MLSDLGLPDTRMIPTSCRRLFARYKLRHVTINTVVAHIYVLYLAESQAPITLDDAALPPEGLTLVLFSKGHGDLGQQDVVRPADLCAPLGIDELCDCDDLASVRV